MYISNLGNHFSSLSTCNLSPHVTVPKLHTFLQDVFLVDTRLQHHVQTGHLPVSLPLYFLSDLACLT